MTNALRAGAARAPITGTARYGLGGPFRRRATGIHDDVFARCMAIGDGVSTVALLTLDARGLASGDVGHLRAEVRRRCTAGQLHLLVCGTGVASGPDLLGEGRGCPGPYHRFLMDQAAEVVVRALETMEPAQLVTAPAAMPEALLVETKDAGSPPPMLVVSAVAMDGRPIGTAAVLGCRPDVLGPNNTEVSADYLAFYHEAVEVARGGLSLALPGAVGDQTARDLQAPPAARSFDAARAVGEALSTPVLHALAHATPQTHPTLRVDTCHTDLPLTRSWQARGAWFSTLRAGTPGRVRAEVHAVRFGEVSLFTVPGAPTRAAALQVRDRAAPGLGVLVGCANGMWGLLCPPERMPGPTADGWRELWPLPLGPCFVIRCQSSKERVRMLSIRAKATRLLFLSVTLCLAPASAWAAPKIVAPEPKFDFGHVSQGEKASFTFTLRNDGDGPLKINQVKPSCGCTAALASEDTIAPGAETKITGDVRTAGFQDRITKTVTVLSDDPQTPRLTLTVTGMVDVPFALEPRYVNFGQVELGTGGTQTAKLIVRDSAKLPVTLGAVVVKHPSVTVDVAPSDEADPPQEFTLTLTLDKSASQGVISTPIDIPIEGEKQPLRLTLYANVVGPVALYPQTVSLGVVDGSQPVVRNFIAMSPTHTAFTVKEATCDLAGSTVTFEPLPNNPDRVRITVTVDAAALQPGPVDATLTVVADGKETTTLTAKLLGSVRRVEPDETETGTAGE